MFVNLEFLRVKFIRGYRKTARLSWQDLSPLSDHPY